MRRLRSVIASALRALVEILGDRLAPALLTGAGIFLVTVGLWGYISPANGGTGSDAPETLLPSVAASTPTPSVTPTPSGLSSPSVSPGASPTPVNLALATRVVIPSLNIDLPIVAPPANEEFPFCNAAEYLVIGEPLAYPGSPRATYLYAHARKAMFLPLLTESRKSNGGALIKASVEVFTADNQDHIYQITRVLPRQPPSGATLDAALAATSDQLWLQTSEGPLKSSTKLQVVAEPVGVIPATQQDAHPTNTARVCPDAPKCTSTTGGGCKRS